VAKRTKAQVRESAARAQYEATVERARAIRPDGGLVRVGGRLAARGYGHADVAVQAEITALYADQREGVEA
jgi:hypothetical protein